MKKAFKIAGIVFGLLIIAIAVVIMLLPGLVKDYVEENDLDLIGREISLNEVKLEWTKLKFGLCKLEIKEQDGISTFTSADSLLVDLDFWPLLNGELSVEEIKLCKAEFNIVQTEEKFNFNTLFPADESDEAEKKVEDDEPFIFSLRNIKISNTKVNYRNNHGQSAGVHSLEVFVPLLDNKLDTIQGNVDFNLLSGGTVHIDSRWDLGNSGYAVDLMCNEIDLLVFEPYLKEFMNASGFKGKLSNKLSLAGSLAESTEIAISGDVFLNDLNLNSPEGEKLIAFKEFHVGMDSIDVKENIYDFNGVILEEAFVLFELFDEDDNFSRLIISPDSAIAELSGEEVDFTNPFSVLAKYIRDIAESYTASDYHLDSLVLKNSEFVYNDYTLHELFRYRLNGLNVRGDSLDSDRDFLELNAESGLNGSGLFQAELKAYTSNLNNIDLWYKISNTSLSDFSPYTNYFVAHQIDNGELNYENTTHIRDGKIVSENKLNFNQFSFAKKSPLKALYSLPVRLAVSLMKDLDGNINLDLPIEGDLKDPEYKIGKVIWSTIKNILLKAVSAPYRMIAGLFGGNEEDLKELKFQHLQRDLSKDLEKQLDRLSTVLQEKEDLNLEFKLVSRKYEEAESMAIRRAKLNYLFGEIPEELDKSQQKSLSDLDIRDSLFVSHINAKLESSQWPLPIQKKCMLFSGEEMVLLEVDRVGEKRSSAIRDYLETTGQINPDRIRFKLLPEDSLSTYMSTSVYSVGFWAEE